MIYIHAHKHARTRMCIIKEEYIKFWIVKSVYYKLKKKLTFKK